MNTKEMLDEIRQFIETERIRRGISEIDRTQKMELSGIMKGVDGDILSLIERQLMTTEFGFGAWDELKNQEILKETYRVIKERLK